MFAPGSCGKIPVFSHFIPIAGATTATERTDQFFRALQAEKNWQPAVRTVPPYCDRSALISRHWRARSSGCGDAAKKKPEVLVPPIIGCPSAILMEADPYSLPVPETFSPAARGTGLGTESKLITTFQSSSAPKNGSSPIR